MTCSAELAASQRDKGGLWIVQPSKTAPVRTVERFARIVDSGILPELTKTELMTLCVYLARADITDGTFCISADHIGQRIGAKDRGRVAEARRQLVARGIAKEHRRGGKGAPLTELVALPKRSSAEINEDLATAGKSRKFHKVAPVTALVTPSTCHGARDSKEADGVTSAVTPEQEPGVTSLVSDGVTSLVADGVTSAVTQTVFLTGFLTGGACCARAWAASGIEKGGVPVNARPTDQDSQAGHR